MYCKAYYFIWYKFLGFVSGGVLNTIEYSGGL